MRRAFSTAAKSITSCASAPATGGRNPINAATMPSALSAIPPTALWSAITRMRRPIWISSSTLASDASRIDKQCSGARSFLSHDGDFLLRTLISVHSSNPQPPGNIAYL